MTPSRQGNTLVIVLALALLLAVQISIVNTLSIGGFRHLNKVNAHVRAITVGESAFARILARIKGAPWEDRWFALAPKAESSVQLMGGSYTSYIATVPGPDKQADVWIQSRYEGSVAVMFWRVRYVDDTLDFMAQVYPTFFTFLPPDAPSPADGPNRTTTALADQMDRQRQNRDPALKLLDDLAGKRSLTEVATRLDIPLRGRPLDTFTPPGGAPVPQVQYLTDIQRDLDGLPAPPADPPPPPTPTPPAALPSPPPSIPTGAWSSTGQGPQTALGQKYPAPTNLPDVLRQIFTDAHATPPIDPDLPTGTYFANPTVAQQEWQTASNQLVVSWETPAIQEEMNHTTLFVAQLAARNTPADPRPECTAAADQLMGYYADITTARTHWGSPPPPAPDPATVDPSPRDAAGYTRALNAYTAWWMAHH